MWITMVIKITGAGDGIGIWRSYSVIHLVIQE